MLSYEFQYGPKLIAGPGAARRLREVLPPGPCLFVTDANVRALGLADAVLGALPDAIIFDAVEQDPSRETLMAAVAAGEGAVSVVGFGGGSPMDVAKLAAYLIATGEDLDALWGVGKALGRKLPLALVPTTAGTGSEATPVTVITVGSTEKRGVNSPALLPDWAVLDPELTLSLPRAVTAATGIDAMVHAIEAYTSARLKNPMSDMFARKAMRLISDNLLKACDAPDDIEARGKMLLAAHLAGIAFANAPVAGVHALAYPLGGHFHVPHGLSNALMLTHVLGHNMQAAMPLYAELGAMLDPGIADLGQQGRAQGFVQHLSRLSRATGVPRRLSEVGVGPEHLDLLAAEAMKQERLLINNPCPISQADARRLYEAAL
ncbi:MAG TPA: iron-containing alcohol dehydrogenase [Allosphingosinicella sp.]|jgi:alcohol dehydrogenase class IV|nr:iron-containing alcohol dehydrogenase [Allosphingosinicella sp.]